MIETAPLAIAVQYGLPTVLLFVMGMYIQRKEKAWAATHEALIKMIIEEQNARIKDGKDAFDKLSTAQAGLIAATNKLAEIQHERGLTHELIDAIRTLEDVSAEVHKYRPGPKPGGR